MLKLYCTDRLTDSAEIHYKYCESTVIRPKTYCVNRYLRLSIEHYLHVYFCRTFDLENTWYLKKDGNLSFEIKRNDLNPFIKDLRFELKFDLRFSSH